MPLRHSAIATGMATEIVTAIGIAIGSTRRTARMAWVTAIVVEAWASPCQTLPVKHRRRRDRAAHKSDRRYATPCVRQQEQARQQREAETRSRQEMEAENRDLSRSRSTTHVPVARTMGHDAGVRFWFRYFAIMVSVPLGLLLAGCSGSLAQVAASVERTQPGPAEL